jgi:hypothetical protein
MEFTIGDKVIIQVNWTSINEKETIATVTSVSKNSPYIITVYAHGNYFQKNVLKDYIVKIG